MPKTELYIGNLTRDVSKKDIESVFDKYGRLLRCDLKDKGAQVYAFLEFEDSRDAEDALLAENGKDMCGSAMVVEWAKGKADRRDRYDRDRGYGGRGGGYRNGGGGGRSLECYECGERGHFARDCRNKRSGGRSGGYRDSRNGGDRDRRDRDRDRRDSRRRSRSHSRDRRQSRSRSRSYDRSRNMD